MTKDRSTLIYRTISPPYDDVLKGRTQEPPEVEIRAQDGVRHELWAIRQKEVLEHLTHQFDMLDALYVADGHHRTAAAARVCDQRRQGLESPSKVEPCHYFLAAHFPAEQLKVLEYNRIVRDLNGLSAAELVERIRGAGFDVKQGHRSKNAPHKQSFGMYLDRRWYLVTARSEIIRPYTEANLDEVGHPNDGLYLRGVLDSSSNQTLKTNARIAIEKAGYTIVASIGNNDSDLEGGHAERTFKLPDYDGKLV